MKIEERGPYKYDYDIEQPEAAARESHRRKRRSKAPLIIVIIAAAAVAAAAGLFLYSRLSYSSERVDLTGFFGTEDGSTAVYLNNEFFDPEGEIIARTVSGTPYLRLDWLQDRAGCRLYYTAEGTLRYMYPEEIAEIFAGGTSWTCAGRTTELGHEVFFADAAGIYVAADAAEAFSDMTVDYYPDPDRVMVRTEWGDVTMAVCGRSTQVRMRGGRKSPILVDMPEGAVAEILTKVDDWTQVSYGGVTGYVPSSALGPSYTETIESPGNVPAYPNISLGAPVIMIWDAIYYEQDGSSLAALIDTAPGTNVISPTWYAVSGADGSFQSFSSAAYVQQAHSLGLQVWAMVDDFNAGVSREDLTAALNSSSARQALISGIVGDVMSVGADGINLDFENIWIYGLEDGFLAFMREMSAECRRNGLVLSVNNFLLSGGQTHDLAEQELICDYVVMMSYDEYSRNSPEPGPVASSDWFRAGVADTVNAGVSPSKLINGFAAFTRLWWYGSDGELSNSTLNMREAGDRAQAAGATPTWDGMNGLNFSTWEADGATYLLWYENVTSVTEKMNAVEDYGIAGIAVWSGSWWENWDDAEVWNVFRTSLGA